jgi:hypothetical protein
LCYCASDRWQEPERGGKHSDYAQCHSAYCGLQRDAAHALGDMDEFIDAGQGRFQNDSIGSL